jgi:Flp pilus assembly protein CpaB
MNRPVNLILIIVTAASLVTAGYFYTEVGRIKANPQAELASVAASELKEVVAKVGRLVVLPTDEEPTLATVADPEKLKDQPFFANAKAGDKVLVYNQAQKAILYDPVQDKIIEIAPITNNN